MKKMIVFFKCLGSLVIIFFILFAFIGMKSFVDKGKMIFQFFSKYNEATLITYDELNFDSVPNGDFKYYTFSKLEENKMLNIFENCEVDGVMLKFSNEVPFSYFKSVLKSNFYQGGSAEGMDIYYGFYQYYDDYIWVDGKKLNFQLVQKDDGWLLGMPMILTGF